MNDTRTLPCRNAPPSTPRRLRFWAVRGSALLISVGLLQAARPALVGTPGARIYVRWTAGVDDSARAQLQRELQLTEGRPHEGATWTYAISDVSPRHIREIVTHPSVADTHKLNRLTFQIEDAERTPRRGGLLENGDTVSRLLDALVTTIAALAVAAFALGLRHLWPGTGRAASRLDRLDEFAAHPSAATRLTISAAGKLLQRGVPVIDAWAAGVFRAAFGGLLLLFLFLQPVDASWLANPDSVQVTGALHGFFLDFLVPRPWLVDRVWVTSLVLGAAFTVGLYTRWTFTAFVVAFLLWVAVYVALRGSHTSTAIAIAVVALLPSRWGDGFSVDAVMGRVAAPAASGRRYGYSVWIPSVVIGLCFAAAAWSKVKDGIAWIANGTVAFHFITDSPQALVSWGLWVARSYPLAVAFSLVAVLTEALIITSMLTRRSWYRAAAGFGALSLLAGFALFQGVFWPTWWVLLLGFLPWERIASTPALEQAGGSLSLAQVVTVALLLLQQVVMSGLGAEAAPLFSSYDMYSATYATRDAFDRSRPITYRLVDMSGGSARTLACSVDEPFVTAFQHVAAGTDADRALLAQRLQACAVPRHSLEKLALVGDRLRFDWERGELTSERGTTIIGPVSLARVVGPRTR